MIRDYNKYQFTKKENILCSLYGITIILVLSILFYRSIIGILLLSPILYFHRERVKQLNITKRKWKLNLEFKDGIAALSAALEAGYSTENAFDQAGKDLRLMYDEESMIIQEFSFILNQIRMNITAETALSEFAQRSNVDDIQSFSEVFATAKRTGGDLIAVIKTTKQIINDKIEVKGEIMTLISAKRLESNVMKVIPLFILCYLATTSPGFLEPLYHNVLGIMIMSILLIIYFIAFLIIDKIISIEV